MSGNNGFSLDAFMDFQTPTRNFEKKSTLTNKVSVSVCANGEGFRAVLYIGEDVMRRAGFKIGEKIAIAKSADSLQIALVKSSKGWSISGGGKTAVQHCLQVPAPFIGDFKSKVIKTNVSHSVVSQPSQDTLEETVYLIIDLDELYQEKLL